MLFGKIPLSKEILNIAVSGLVILLYGFLKNCHAYAITVN